MDSKMTLSHIEKIFQDRAPGIIGEYRNYAVLVPLVMHEGELCLLFEVRSDALKRQPGEVCFPGGKMELGESEEECALRETVEELGIPREEIRVVAQLDSLFTYSNFTMYSFLGVIGEKALSKAEFNRLEVKEIFYVPVSYLIENEPFIYKMDIVPDIRDDFPYDLVNFTNGYNWRKGNSEVPIYHFRGKSIWGLTARITHNLVKILAEKA